MLSAVSPMISSSASSSSTATSSALSSSPLSSASRSTGLVSKSLDFGSSHGGAVCSSGGISQGMPHPSVLHNHHHHQQQQQQQPHGPHHNNSNSQQQQQPTSTHSSSIFKNITVTRHMDSSSSPRLMLRFQHIKTKENSRSGESPRKYSVTLGTNDYNQPVSPAYSSSSQESDLCDSQVTIPMFGSRRGGATSMSNTHSQLNNSQVATADSTSGSPGLLELPAKLKTDVQSDSAQSVPDSQMPTLSQESQPFSPAFEDISDAEESQKKMKGSQCSVHNLNLSVDSSKNKCAVTVTITVILITVNTHSNIV